MPFLDKPEHAAIFLQCSHMITQSFDMASRNQCHAMVTRHTHTSHHEYTLNVKIKQVGS